MSKIGRNEFCPCGSGKKFKKCCLVQSVTGGTRMVIKSPAEEGVRKLGYRIRDYPAVIPDSKKQGFDGMASHE
jgi:hypothetical protein